MCKIDEYPPILQRHRRNYGYDVDDVFNPTVERVRHELNNHQQLRNYIHTAANATDPPPVGVIVTQTVIRGDVHVQYATPMRFINIYNHSNTAKIITFQDNHNVFRFHVGANDSFTQHLDYDYNPGGVAVHVEEDHPHY